MPARMLLNPLWNEASVRLLSSFRVYRRKRARAKDEDTRAKECRDEGFCRKH